MLSKDEARRITANFAKPPELLGERVNPWLGHATTAAMCAIGPAIALPPLPLRHKLTPQRGVYHAIDRSIVRPRYPSEWLC
jgi:hypothetical protein